MTGTTFNSLGQARQRLSHTSAMKFDGTMRRGRKRLPVTAPRMSCSRSAAPAWALLHPAPWAPSFGNTNVTAHG